MNDRLGLSIVPASVLLVLCALIGGVAALIAVLVCYFLLNFGGVESADKHGISSNPAIRIGGVLIVVYLLLNVSFQSMTLTVPALDNDVLVVLLGSLAFFMLGLWEDLHGVLSARFRFITMLLLSAGLLISAEEFVLLPVGQPIIDTWILNHYAAAWFFTVVCLAFLPNAFNTADGANGLVSGLSLVVVVLLSLVAPPGLVGFLHSVAVACVLFLIYNLSTGRFFLGDGGAYFLGALVGLCLILTANKTDVSMWFLATLIFYPVADLVFSMVRRVLDGRAPFSADNEHFHNVVYGWLRKRVHSARTANTATGVGIAIGFGGMVILAQLVWQVDTTSDAWLWLYALLWGVYALVWFVLSADVRRVKARMA